MTFAALSASWNRTDDEMAVYQVKLPAFEGPFDLLFHLIEEQKVNIYDIPIAGIAQQYLDYIHMMEILDMDVASEFLVMAATLLEIKSKMLLPQVRDEHNEGEDGYEGEVGLDAREELINKLIEYKRFKLVALQLREMERGASRIFTRSVNAERPPEEILQIHVGVHDLLNLYQGLIRRRLNPLVHRVVIDRLSLTERVSEIRTMLRTWSGREVKFRDLVKEPNNKYQIVLSFMAILEMAKHGELELLQSGNFKPITLRAHAGAEAAPPVELEATA